MKKALYIFCLLVFSALLCAQKAPSAGSILKAVDKNMLSSTSKSTTRMVIHSKRSSRTVESINYSSGSDKYYSEYTAPPREKGTKMLKVGDKLWIYEPSSDRTIQISGNMLKQSVMGSDLSYEDFMEETKLEESYTATVTGDSKYDGREVWVLELVAKQKNLAYHKLKLYVDKERYVVLYQYMYAKSGKLLKTIKAGNVGRVGSRWYPRYILFKDELKDGKGTEYYVDAIAFDLKIPAATFTKAMLKK
ncbi:MAG TPA: outer membrane lipoprotein-sorting protein [Candidatus Cloacimonadota bacterium]|nr:outer membrane lipoprotein-sorting protein [Candidatus Cloacimonadota bacterium]HOH78106.1 outer membrane lipoprotein-sorting protein [Candidatus Cloacimonadota bacterium]